MNSDHSEICSALNNILQFLYDSQVCFAKHIDNVQDSQLKSLFKTLTKSRESMIDEIKKILIQFNYSPKVKGTLLGKTHLVFENLKSAFTGGDPLAITKEVRRGEGVLIDYYKRALALNLPSEIKAVLLQHLNKIENDIKQAELLSIT